MFAHIMHLSRTAARVQAPSVPVVNVMDEWYTALKVWDKRAAHAIALAQAEAFLIKTEGLCITQRYMSEIKARRTARAARQLDDTLDVQAARAWASQFGPDA